MPAAHGRPALAALLLLTASKAAYSAMMRPCSIMKSWIVPRIRKMVSGSVNAASTAACPDWLDRGE